MLKVKRLTETAVLPTRGTPESAGLDLYCDEHVTVRHGRNQLVSTGISVKIPEGHCGLIWPRSGLSMKGLDVMAGCVDEDYTGEVGVLVTSHTDKVVVAKGDRVAQLLIVPINYVDVEEVEELTETERGENGWGSTGE